MIIFIISIVPVRAQMTNTQRMNNSETITQKIPNSHVYSLDESEWKMINADEIK